MPEQSAITITASLAPQAAAGLHSLVQKTLAGTEPQAKQRDDRRAGDTIINRSEGTVRGTLFQIGKVEGGFHDHGSR